MRPAGFALSKGEEVDLGDVAELLAGCGYERCEQVTDRGQFAVRGGILDVFGSTEDRAARIELFGDEIESIRYFSTFTQRSLAEADRIELDPAAEIDPDHRILAEEALADNEEGDDDRPLAELLPTDRFGAFLDLIDERTAIVVAAAEEIGPALRDHLTDVRAAIHDEDVAKLYVEVEEPLAARAVLEIQLTGDEAEGDEGRPASAARSRSPPRARSPRRSPSSRSRPARATSRSSRSRASARRSAPATPSSA